ncbi:hypothetical protein METESE_23980 [Mesoterricola sediminis]|uniref:Lanthionine synthetase n=2 Tax=Mesoterricola sediminis TaxID=2927980 RepID=A0AA48GXH3_9BACT|nr:hypothetical protein METESE_23980 [Mesoterricola sediminis]
MDGSWRPLLAGPRLKQARAAVDEILDSLPAPQESGWGATLAGGHAGFALAFAYAARGNHGKQGPAWKSRALAHLETSVALLPELRERPGLYAGYSGVAWTVDHLQKMGILDEPEDLNEAVDSALVQLLEKNAWRVPCELIDGLAGIGLYALDRPGGAGSQKVVRLVLERLLASEHRVLHGGAGHEAPIDGWTGSRPQEPDGRIDLGVAHGIPGILGFLASAYGQGHAPALPLLERTLTWLLSCRMSHPDGFVFGRWVNPGNSLAMDGCRLSWCYGDLGIAAVMLGVAKSSGKERWRQVAIHLGSACAERREPWAGIHDAALCHGAAGDAHLFSRLYQETGMARFRDRALEGYDMALGMRRAGTEAGGFLAYIPATEGSEVEWNPDPGWLNGSAGIALSFLAGMDAGDPGWDRPMLVTGGDVMRQK